MPSVASAKNALGLHCFVQRKNCRLTAALLIVDPELKVCEAAKLARFDLRPEGARIQLDREKARLATVRLPDKLERWARRVVENARASRVNE